MVKNYWLTVHRQALKEACKVLRIETGARLILVIILFVLADYIIWTSGGHQIAKDDIIVRTASIDAILLAFPVVYLWKFVAIPPQMDREKIDKISDLAAKVAKMETSEEVLLTLQSFCNMGRDLVEKHKNNGPAHYLPELSQWQNDLRKYINDNLSAYYPAFCNIELSPQSALQYQVNLYINPLKDMMDKYAKDLYADKEAA